MDLQEREIIESKLEEQALRFPEVYSKRLKEFEKRIERHLMQEAVDRKFCDGSVDEDGGNERLFGSIQMIPPPVPGEAWTIEAPFSLVSNAAGGRIVEKFVTLRCWSDIKLDRSIELNNKMALLVSEGKLKKDVVLDITTVTVVMWLRLHGQFFWLYHENDDTKDPDESMYFDFGSMQLRRIASKDFKTWLHAHSGINPANDRAWKQMLEAIKTASTNPDISRGVKPGNLFDRRGDVIYISCGPSYMARVDASGVKMVPNGTDGVVFALGKTLARWNLLDEKDGKNPFTDTQVFGNANYASEHGRMILMMWFLTLPACIRNYPIILFHGRYRSGKTRCAQAIFELLGIPVSLNSVQDNGQEDFWTLLNAGGVACFDNVDGRVVKWFPNDIQIASTGGSKTARKKFTDCDTVRISALAKIMMTANDPRFMCDSGISDRILQIELGPFTSSVKKDSEDQKLTDEIVQIRSAAFTWMAFTISRALENKDDVRKNLNKRHPDFARFALRVSRALGLEAEGISALVYAEFNKSYQTVLTDRVSLMIFEVIRSKIADKSKTGDSTPFSFYAGEMVSAIRERFGDDVDDDDRQITSKVVGRVMTKHLSEFGACFNFNPPRTLKGKTLYSFTSFTDTYSNIAKKSNEDEEECSHNENAMSDDEMPMEF